jgi:hypothetical protein
VCVYTTRGITISGQLVAAYDDALVLSQASLQAPDQTRERAITGEVRIPATSIDFYEREWLKGTT